MKDSGNIRLETIATSEDGKELPKQKKAEVDINRPKDIILYKDRMFEVHNGIIHYLANQPERLENRIAIAQEDGMSMMYPDGGFGCMYCRHYPFNPAVVAVQTGMTVCGSVGGEPGIYVEGCSYNGREEVGWAGVKENKQTKECIMARMTPCVVYDAMIEDLVESGYLDDYEIEKRAFDYPTIIDVAKNPELKEKFMVESWEPNIEKIKVKIPEVKPKRGVGTRIVGWLKKTFG